MCDQIKLVSAPRVNVLMKTMLTLNLNLRIFSMMTNIPHYSYSVSNANADKCSSGIRNNITPGQDHLPVVSVFFPAVQQQEGVLIRAWSYSRFLPIQSGIFLPLLPDLDFNERTEEIEELTRTGPPLGGDPFRG